MLIANLNHLENVILESQIIEGGSVKDGVTTRLRHFLSQNTFVDIGISVIPNGEKTYVVSTQYEETRKLPYEGYLATTYAAAAGIAYNPPSVSVSEILKRWS